MELSTWHATIGEWYSVIRDVANLWLPAIGTVFITAVVGAAGAFYGGRGAQRAINQEQALAAIVDELRAINLASSLALVILNRIAALRKQTFLPLQVKQSEYQRLYEKAQRTKREVTIPFSLQNLPPFSLAITNLERLAYDRMSLDSRPLGALGEISQANFALNSLVASYDEMIVEIRGLKHDTAAAVIIGFKTERGIDSRFQNIVSGLDLISGDLMFYLRLFVNDVLAHGAAVRDSAPASIQKRLPALNQVNWDAIPDSKNLFPADEMYVKWMRGYKSAALSEKKSPTSRIRLWGGALSKRLRTWRIVR